MTRLVRDIVLSEAALQLRPPRRGGTRDGEEPRVYTERDLAEAVRAATQRGKEIAAREAEAYVRGLDLAVQSALEALTESLIGLERHRAQLLADLSGPVLGLALEIAQVVVGQEIALRPEGVEGVVRELLDELQDAERITVRLAPGTLEVLRERGGAVEDDRVRWVSDASLGAAEARVDSDRGGYDATLRTRWSRVEEALRDARFALLEAADPEDDRPIDEEDGP